MTITNIASGFRTTGIYPFNPDIILTKLSRSQQQLDASSSGVTEETTFSPDIIKSTRNDLTTDVTFT